MTRPDDQSDALTVDQLTIDEDELVAITRRLVRCPGTNPPGEELARALELAAIARELGLEVELTQVAPGRPNVTVTLPATASVGAPGNGSDDGPGDEHGALLLLGHTDVVPLGDGWTREPFGAQLEDGRIYGRGSTDMLGGLVACLVAMAALRRAGTPLTGDVVLVAAVDEEELGLGIRDWIARPLPHLAGCIVAEPTSLQPIVAARGDSYLQIDVRGVAAHAGRPDDGRNAIYGAAAVVTALEQWHADLAAEPLVLDGMVGAATLNVGTIRGGQATSTVPPHCVVDVDRRLLPGEDPAQVLAEARRRIDALDLPSRGLSVECAMTMDMPGFATDPSGPFVRAVLAALDAAGGPGLPPAGWTAACDGGFVARETGAPVVVLGPGSVTEQAHRPDESVGVDELAVAARCYARVAATVLARRQ